MQQHEFDIPAQALPQALLAYSRASGVQVLFDSKRASGLRSAAVKGRMSGGQALRMLLRGTGFGIRYASSSSVTLVTAGMASDEARLELNPLVVKAAPLHVGGRPAYADYADNVLGNLRRALQTGELAARGRYEITVKIWLDSSGRIARSEVQKSTGDPELDALVLRQLATVVTLPPPENLPQPLRFQLWTRPS